MATRLQIARAALTKEQYLAMKEKGLSDATIMDRAWHKQWNDILTAFKKEWGLGGMSLKKVETLPTKAIVPPVKNDTPPVAQVEDPAAVPEPIQVDEEISFITPSQQTIEPILRICDRWVVFNASATKLMAGVKFVRVGVTSGGVIILIPVDSHKGAYKISNSSGKSDHIKIGGGALTKGLKSNGISYGKYLLEYNKARNRYEAGTEVAE